MRKTDISQFDEWDWFQIALGLAHQMKMWNNIVKNALKEAEDDILEWAEEKQIAAAQALEVVCSHQDRMLRTKDPCSDCEPIRDYPEIAEAFKEYYEMFGMW